jgi:lipopolysaccharide/colanic/teichoic acid biosynthesis glycosyltransferase
LKIIGYFSMNHAAKRIIDICLALVGLLLCLPAMAAIALLIRLKLGRPVLFIQYRPGYQGRLFRLIKFRTMAPVITEEDRALPDDARLTPLGRWLRQWSLDELPEFWNVLKGEMSLVGPRPLLPEYLARYTPEQARRHDVLPGITGWAQINGRNHLSWEEKFQLDLWYVEHWTPVLDLRIIMKTVLQVLRRQGIASQGHATMSEFEGTRPNTRP